MNLSTRTRARRRTTLAALSATVASIAILGASTALAQDRPGNGPDGARGGQGGDRQEADRGNRGDRGDRGNRGGWWGNRGEDGRGGGQNWRGRDGGPGQGLGLMGTPDGLFSPDYLTRDVPMVVKELQLDDAQRAIIAQLFQDYDTNFRELLDALRATTEELRESYEPEPEIEARMEEVREHMGQMRDDFRAAREEFGDAFGRGGRGFRGDRGPQADEANEGNAPSNEEGDDRGMAEVDVAERDARIQELRDDFRSRVDEHREQMRSIREQRTASPQMQEMLDNRVALIRNFAQDKLQLRNSTTLGIRALLVEEQVDSWSALEQVLRRKRVLSRGRLSGESTNVLEVLEDIEPDDQIRSEDLDMLLVNYVLDLDEALKARENFDYGEGLDLMEHLRHQDFDQGLSVMKKRLSLQESTRDVNDQYIEAISVVLAAPMSDEFRRQALMAGYSRVFRPTRGERAMLAAMEIEDLDPELLEAVAELMQNHGSEISSINEDILVVLRSVETDRELERAEQRINRFRGERRDQEEFDPVREAYEKRNDVDERYLATLKSLLGPEQYEAVAGRRDRGRRGDGGSSREDFMSQFDANGDGEIDDAERQAIRDAMRERFRGGGRGGQGGGGQPREL